MQITITSVDPQLDLTLTLDVSNDITVADLVALIAADVGNNISAAALHLYHNGQLLNDRAKTLEQTGLTEGDMVALHVAPPRTQRPAQGGSSRQGSQQQRPGQGQGRSVDTETLRRQVLGDFRLMQQLQDQAPELAEAVNDAERFRNVYETLERQRREQERQKAFEFARLEEDPFNEDSQRKIEEIIRKEAIQENLRKALELHPESFGRVFMLYVDVEVNGTRVKAFVDSGAQTTIMSPSCAEKCGIMRLVDTGFAGIARGVGTAKILGQVHSAMIRIGTLYLDSTFTVMEGKGVELLLGLDMLKRFQAKIDLAKNVLEIQGQEIPFLGEADIPKNEWEEEVVETPAGAKVGTQSGTVVEPPKEGGASAFSGSGRTLGASSSSATPAPASHGALPAQGGNKYPEESVQQLMQLGFTREVVIQALDAVGGNADMAASMLFSSF